MSYEKQIWEELPSEETPFSAERMNHIEEGIDSKLDKMVVQKILNTAGWYRVAKYEETETAGNGQNAMSFIAIINTRYGNNANMSAILGINIVYSYAKITNLSSKARDNAVITKARVVSDNGVEYLEIYYNANQGNLVSVNIIGQSEYDNRNNIAMLDFEAPIDIVTVLDELSIGEFTTGVEYATNEFLDGKRIYKKRINCGTLPNTTIKRINHNIQSINEITDFSGYGKAESGAVFGFNWYNQNVETIQYCNLQVTKTEIVISSNYDTTMYTGYVTICYTKN